MTPSLDIRHRTFQPLARSVNPGDFWSADPDEVGDYVSSRFAPHRLHVTESGCTAVELRALSLKAASFYTVQYNKDAMIDGVAGNDFYLVQAELPDNPVNPGWRGTQGGLQIISPGDAFELRKRAHSPYLVVKLARETIEERFRASHQILLNGPIRFDLPGDRGDEMSRFIRETVAHIAGQFHLFPQLSSDPRMEGHYVSIMAEILLTLRNNYSASIEAYRQEVLPWHVRRARDMIEGALQQGSSVSVAELARDVGVCVRTLQTGFQRFLGKGPNHYIRSAKLELLHGKLAAAEPNARVTDLMTECGIYDFGRFAHLYRMTYGRTPSEELRRASH